MTGVVLALLLAAPTVPPAVSVCYNYRCARQVAAPLEQASLARIERLFAASDSAETERLAISLAVGMLGRAVSAYAPIAYDQARNPWTESDVDGRMDCIDHSTNTQRMLALLHARGFVRYHEPGPRVRRNKLFVFATHWTATIRELASGERYAVDTWFRRNGYPAVVMPLEAWKRGGSPDE
jgi:hypothetical protein